MSRHELLLREDASAAPLEIRSIEIRAETLDEDARTVDAVLATENPIERWSYDEILRVDKAELPEQMPLLATHDRWSLDSVLGSVRNIRTEGDQLVGRLHFARDDPDAERSFRKLRQGHLTDVSVGYRITKMIEVSAGTSTEVEGRKYTAPEGRSLRIAVAWTPKEASLVPVGADPAAKIRENESGQRPKTSKQEMYSMNKKLRAYLESIGLRAEADTMEAWSFFDKLEGDKQRAAGDLLGSREEPTPPADAPPAPKPSAAERNDPPTDPPTDPPDAAAIAKAERERISQIREIAGEDLEEKEIARAIDENWTVDRVRQSVLQTIRDRRNPPVGTDAPAGHVRSHERDCTRDALGAGLMLRHGLDPVRQHARFVEGVYRPYREDESRQGLERAADAAWDYRDMSLVDVCREACRLDGINVSHNRGEMIRAAVSGSTLLYIFTTSVNAQLLGGYSDYPDTTLGWTSDSDVPDFKTNERVAMGKFGALKRLGRGGTADHLGQSDSKEEYKVARYASKFVVDEMDIIDDRFGAINQVAPSDMGDSAAQLRPNMVYAIILANAALGADSIALFDTSTHKNYLDHANGALDAGAIAVAITAIAKQRIQSRPLNIRSRYLIVPQDLRFTAEVLLKSAERIIASASGGTYNPLQNLGIELRSDDRMGVAGVTDPATETAYAGKTTNWLLSAKPGENGAKTIEVGYLRGTGRAPQIRSYVLSQGQWGIGWDINLDLGAKALDYRAFYFTTGA